MPTARRWLTAGAVNGKIYAIGGSNAGNAVLPTVEEYTPGAPKDELFAISPQSKLTTKWGSIKSGR